ncbi:MAG TPA: 5-formyltetrahydrofolate cyclo-ligase [Candidatus Peribacteraceae bacterium]|nr:5-formyltetrahydrofolate cyclo-ligase [Candidatus Peribacteraceae bacterium]
MHIRDEKELLRQRIKERGSRVSDKDRLAESRSICRRIVENLPAGPLTVCAYAAMRSEADLHTLLEELLARPGTRIFLPRFTRSFFEFREIHALDDLTPGRFNLPEPLPSSALLNLKDVTLALLPGIAFDRSGNRLGRGNGGYDRWLADLRKFNPDANVWGIALEYQLTDKIPVEPHDLPVDAVVTPRELIVCTM